MRNQAINWTEGMFLRPQHFQASDRHLIELFSTSNQLDHACNYGFVEILINEKALANFQLELLRCKARLPDGTIVAFNTEHVDRIDLRNATRGSNGLIKAFAENENVTVFLAVPKYVEGRPNVSTGKGEMPTRYVSFELECDDECAGGNRQALSFRDHNVRILLSTDDLQGFDCLPVCRLVRARDGETPMLDAKYFPPCLSVNAWHELSINVFRAIYDLIGTRVSHLTTLLRNRSIDWSSQRPGDLQKLYMAGALNEALGTLTCLSFAQGVHPFTAYCELCRIIGRLSILGPDKRSPEYPRYDHDDLASIFWWALREIEKLTQLPDEAVEQKWFIGAGRVIQVSLDPKWFTAEWQLFIGVHYQSMTKEKFIKIFSDEAPDWKFGSVDQVEEIFRQKKRGVRPTPVRQVPSELSGRGNWLFFAVQEDNEYWQHVKISNSLAIRIRDDQIYNLADLEGNRQIILQLAGQLVNLELAIFAVRTTR